MLKYPTNDCLCGTCQHLRRRIEHLMTLRLQRVFEWPKDEATEVAKTVCAFMFEQVEA